MYQLLKRFFVLLYFYVCCVPVGCDDVLYVKGKVGINLTVTFTLNSEFENHGQINMYQNNSKICFVAISNGACFSCKNGTQPSVCISRVLRRNISLIFTHLIQSGVYHLGVITTRRKVIESNRVNLTVYPADYTTTCSTVTATLFNSTSTQPDASKKKASLMMFVPVLVVTMLLLIILLGLLYWSCRRKRDKTPAVSSTSAPQEIPDISCVEYCALDFPNQAGEQVRSTEERVEYSHIVFPTRKLTAQDNGIKPTTQQNKIKPTTLQRTEKETDRISEKPKTSKPKHHT